MNISSLCGVCQTTLQMERALKQLLWDKHMLIIVDDVWLDKQLDLFKRLIGFKSQ
jgi:hypothetical protein